MASWLVGLLAVWLAGRLAGWLAGYLASLLFGWFAGWLREIDTRVGIEGELLKIGRAHV